MLNKMYLHSKNNSLHLLKTIDQVSKTQETSFKKSNPTSKPSLNKLKLTLCGKSMSARNDLNKGQMWKW